MSESTKKKWVPIAGALFAALGSFAALIVSNVISLPTVRVRIPSGFARFQPSDPINEKPLDGMVRLDEIYFTAPNPGWTRAILRRNQHRQMGHVILTYRGLSKRSMILLESVIPDLDPHFAYSHKIPVSKAKNGFRTGGERLVLLSASQSKIQVLHRSIP
ncbi:MAG: hypothetical protein PVJ84_05580 [Desulfobacteraceae bacterium]|jgi:hypothetical protein